MRITIYLPDKLAKKIDDERRRRKKIPTISSIIQDALELYFSKKRVLSINSGDFSLCRIRVIV